MLYKLLPLPLKVSLDNVMLVNLSARRVTNRFYLDLDLGLNLGLGVNLFGSPTRSSQNFFRLKDLYLQLKTSPLLWFYKQFLI